MEIIDDFEFLSLWQEISGALVRIAGQIGPVKKHEWQNAIDKFLKEPLTAEDERNVEELLSWYKSDIDVKESLEELKVITKEGMDQLKGDHGLLEERISMILQGLETAYREDAQVTRGHLTRKSAIGSSPQVGASEELSALEEATWNGRIVCESESGVNEIYQKYGQLKALQGELGDQILRTRDIAKRADAMHKDFVTKLKERNRTLLVADTLSLVGSSLSLAGSSLSLAGSSLSLAGSSLSLAGSITTLGPLWSILTIGGLFYAFGGLKFLSRCSSKKREPELSQLADELLQIDGQLKEALYVGDKKTASFAQCLFDIGEFCREHPNELVVLRECGHVSTQDILRDINKFWSRLGDFLSISSKTLKEIHEERILGEEEAIVSMNKEPGVIDDDSCAVLEDKMMMKLIRLITAPVIVTTGKMKQ
ncbi:uncharacterized protein [Montipora foliosa]